MANYGDYDYLIYPAIFMFFGMIVGLVLERLLK